MDQKKFFRVRLSDKCSVARKAVNGVVLTKQWQVKVGDVEDFSVFPDVEAQRVVKQGNSFVPAEEASGGAKEATPAPSDNTTNTGNTTESAGAGYPNFADMTVEQLKNILVSKGVASSELRNATKPELIERAEFIWSQNG